MERDTGNAHRAAALRAAEQRAVRLFEEIVRRGLVCKGRTESAVNRDVFELAADLYGIERFWHKRIVRSGPNTLCPYRENPPDRTIEADDIVFLDLGPVFGTWEADLGRTYVVGADPVKLRLARDAEEAWAAGKAFFDTHPDVTGAQLYAHVVSLAAARGWEFGASHCGHLIGEFPHEHIQGEEVRNYIHPDNAAPLRAPDGAGRPRDWILEIHFVDRAREIGAFVEQLWTVP